MSNPTIRAMPEVAVAAKQVLKPASWLAKIDFIEHLTLANNVLISILGEQGSGKSTFAQLLHSGLPAKIKSHLIAASPLFDENAFIQQSLENFVEQSKQQKTHTLLIIDDAHYLSAQCIEALMEALHQQSAEDSHFHVCLISDFSLVSTLNKLAKDTYADMIHSIELGPLSESETKDYVMQSLAARPGIEKMMTDDRIKQFYQLTGGHIVGVNRQMTEFFNRQPVQSLYKIKLFRNVGMAGGVFLVASAMVYLWLSQDYQPAPPQLVSMPIPAQPNVSEVAETAFNSTIPAYNVAVHRQMIEATSLRRIDLANADEDDSMQDKSLVVLDKVVVAPKVLKPSTQAVIQPKKTPVKAAVVKPIIEQSRYTIQLLAGHNMSELQHFAQVHHLNGKTIVRRTQRQGAVWYVLTLGEYSDRQQAKQAVNHLTRDVAQYKPWIRLISELKTSG